MTHELEGYRASILTLEQTITAWLAAKSGRTQSEKTRRAYADTLSQFRSALQTAGLDLNSGPRIVAVLAQGFANQSGDGRSVSSATFNQRLAILSSFYRYALIYGPCDENPIRFVERKPRNTTKAARPLTKEYLSECLSRIDKSSLAGMRDYALISLALTTGRRISELINLQWRDIDLQEPIMTITWKCKGAKTMLDTIQPRTKQALMAYLHKRFGDHIPDDAYVFTAISRNQSCNQHQGRLSIQAASNILMQRIGVSKFHTTRHSFAINMEKAGASLSEIGARLGHNSLQTTAEYMKSLHSAENAYGSTLEKMFGI